MIRALARKWAAFSRAKSGNVAVIFAIATLPVTLAMGAAVDYSMANKAKAALDRYADAAALSAVNASAVWLPADMAKRKADSTFKAQAVGLKRIKHGTISTTVTDDTAGRTVVVKYSAQVSTSFMGLANIDTITVTGSSTANTALPTRAGPAPRFRTPADEYKHRAAPQVQLVPRLTK